MILLMITTCQCNINTTTSPWDSWLDVQGTLHPNTHPAAKYNKNEWNLKTHHLLSSSFVSNQQLHYNRISSIHAEVSEDNLAMVVLQTQC